MGTFTSAAEDYRRVAGARRREQTRRRLLVAADELFREHGYTATTVAAIAERAGVSLQTLYSAWESKSSLFRSAADAAVSDSDLPLSPDAWRAVIARDLEVETGSEPTAQRYLTAVARVFVRVAERTSVYWQLQPGAAAADPEISAGHHHAMAERRTTMEHVAAGVPTDGLRPGLSRGTVVDTLWSLASPEVYALFVHGAGHSPHHFQDWLTDTLLRALTRG